METGNPIKRIAIIGSESTGKTTLARSLALRFQTQWVPEFAREYMSSHSGEYSADDIVQIAKHQLEEEDQLYKTSNRFLFCDTELIISKVWSEDVFGFCPDFLRDQIQQHRYDLYLLTSNDLPWVPDPVRLNPQRRDHFFNLYKKELENNNFPFEIVNGRYEARLFNSILALRKHFGAID